MERKSSMFQIKRPTFMRLIASFMSKIKDYCVEMLVIRFVKSWDMEYLIDENECFKNFPYALETVYVTFQQTNCPSGNMQEGRSISQENKSCMDSKWN
eukprot:IDg17397t1